MELFILVFLVPLILVPIVLLCGFAGCGYTGVATGEGPSVATPSDLHAKATGVDKIELIWQNNTGGPTRFSVNRAVSETSNYDEIGLPTETTFTDQIPGRVEGRIFFYFVRVKIISNPDAGSRSDVARVTTFPATPTNLVATPIDASHVTLSWQNASDTATKFILEHRDSPVSPWHTVFIGPQTTSPAGITPGGSDEFRVTAVVVNGYDDNVKKDIKSVPSDAISGTTGIPIPPPPFKTAYNIPLTTNDASLSSDETIVQRIKAPLANGGAIVRITLHGSTVANLVIDQVTISQVRPGSKHLYDSADDLIEVKAAGKSGVSLPANTPPKALDDTNYNLDPTKDLLIAFHTKGAFPSRKATVPGATMFHKPATNEAGTLPIRSDGYQTKANEVYLLEKIEVS